VEVNYTIPACVPALTASLISSLLVKDLETRLGGKGIKEIKDHLFFQVREGS
jgi:hypothetical protein